MYAPYTSDSESDSYDSDDSIESFTNEDPRYAILRSPTANTQIKTDLGNAPGAPWDSSTNVSSLAGYEYIIAPKTTKTSLFSMKSINRDKNVYPTPYNFKIKLPRVYKNVTKFQLVQLSFPNNSNGVTGLGLFTSSLVQDMKNNGIPDTCTSTCINIITCTPTTNTVAMMEMGRTNMAGQSLLTTVSIPDGLYTNAEVANELTFQANSTPPLNIISWPQFKEAFMNTRDVSILFNEPGDTFFSKIGQRINRPNCKAVIINTYYTQQNIDELPVITEQIAFTTYYFPVLKELIATGMAEPFLKPYDEILERVTGIFEGLDSDFYYNICKQYQAHLDTYRKNLTFELRNVNSYTWKYNDKESRFTTIHNQLHTSIQRDITKSYQTVLNRELALSSLNSSSFTTLKSNAIVYSAIYKHLETNMSSVLGRYALVTNYQYQGGTEHITTESTFNCMGLAEDTDFNAMFQYKSSIGSLYGNYEGTIMSFGNFMDYHNTLSTYYTFVQSTNATVNNIHQSVAINHHMYVSTKYTNILPQKMIDMRAYTSGQSIPVSFVTGQPAYVPGMLPANIAALENTVENTVVYPDSVDTGISIDTLISASSANIGMATTDTYCSTICCNYINKLLTKWYANLPVNTVIGTLNYRLGLVSVIPLKYNIISTILDYTSSGTLNFLMQINDEQGFNNLDIAMNENYTVNNDTTGQLKLVAAKILMGNVGDSGISQTLIQNPSIFENTLGKLDKLTFKIYYDDPAITPAWLYLPFQYEVNEWNATFQIDEEVGFINQDDNWKPEPSIPIPTNPDDTSYIYFQKSKKK
jgi:hypothetical protein